MRKAVGQDNALSYFTNLLNAGLMDNTTLVNTHKLGRQKRLVAAEGLGRGVLFAVLQHKQRVVILAFHANHFLPRKGQEVIVAVTGRNLNTVHNVLRLILWTAFDFGLKYAPFLGHETRE